MKRLFTFFAAISALTVASCESNSISLGDNETAEGASYNVSGISYVYNQEFDVVDDLDVQEDIMYELANYRGALLRYTKAGSAIVANNYTAYVTDEYDELHMFTVSKEEQRESYSYTLNADGYVTSQSSEVLTKSATINYTYSDNQLSTQSNGSSIVCNFEWEDENLTKLTAKYDDHANDIYMPTYIAETANDLYLDFNAIAANGILPYGVDDLPFLVGRVQCRSAQLMDTMKIDFAYSGDGNYTYCKFEYDDTQKPRQIQVYVSADETFATKQLFYTITIKYE